MGQNNKYKISTDIVKNYIEIINSISDPVKLINDKNHFTNKSIEKIKEIIKEMANNLTDKVGETYIELIKQILNENNGMVSTRMLEPLNISRQYLTVMVKKRLIERVNRGMYSSPDVFEDSYYIFQQKYRKVIYSHMTSLFLFGLSEEFPYSFSVSVPQRYHDSNVNKKCNVFYVPNDIYEMGVTDVITPSGNKVRVYDIERSICDIIKSKGRMDEEQVLKTIKQYLVLKEKNLPRLYEYASRLNISNQIKNISGLL